MSSLVELTELAGFFSYSRDDDEDFRGTLSALRDGIQRELSAQLGRSKRTFRLWQDQVAIAPGKLWESEIKKAIDQSFFFIPIITPRSVNSNYCKFEFESFLAREKTLDRSDLIFPILYISVAALENEAKWRDDPVLSTIGRRQYVDWRSRRHLDVHSSEVREQIERFCQKIVEALNEPWTSPEERQQMEEAQRLQAGARRRVEEEEHRKRAKAEARQRADEAQRLKAEAKRRAEEGESRKRAEAEARRRAEEERAEVEHRAEEERKQAELEVEVRRKADEEAEAAQVPRSATPEVREQLEHVSSEQLRTAATSSTVPWRIIAGSAMIVGVIAIAAMWRLGQSVTPQAAPPVTSQSAPSVTAQSAPSVTAQPARSTTSEPAPRVTPQSVPPVTSQDASALYTQANNLLKGLGRSATSQDYAKAREWYEKAADGGNSDAMVSLGLLYANGQGVAQDYAKAREWYEKAAAKDNAVAMNNLGWLYQNGWGVAQDYAKASDWFEKAADKGNADAMSNLGWLYAHGQGVAQDYAKARELYQKAADRGNAEAKTRLEQMPRQ